VSSSTAIQKQTKATGSFTGVPAEGSVDVRSSSVVAFLGGIENKLVAVLPADFEKNKMCNTMKHQLVFEMWGRKKTEL
jgi:hypothetical protein